MFARKGRLNNNSCPGITSADLTVSSFHNSRSVSTDFMSPQKRLQIPNDPIYTATGLLL